MRNHTLSRMFITQNLKGEGLLERGAYWKLEDLDGGLLEKGAY